MKRTALKPWRRPVPDFVTPQLVAYLDARDGRCIVPKVDSAAGSCFGRRTIEHVRDRLPDPTLKRGRLRAPSDPRHTVNVCVGHIEWSKTHRAKELEREWIRSKEGERDHDGIAAAVPSDRRADEAWVSDESGGSEGGQTDGEEA